MKSAGQGLRLLQKPQQVEAALWRRLREDGDSYCRERLFELYARLASTIARGELRRRPAYGLELADFNQLAFGGLLEAIDRYDPQRGAPFEAYARHRIKGAIADGLARSSEEAARFSARRRLEQERMQSLLGGRNAPHGENPIGELAELATALAIGIMAENASLDGAARDKAHLYDSAAWRDLELQVVEEIARLPGAEKTVMQHHYLNDVPFVEIARLLRLSKGRIAQIHRAALMRLRTRLKREE
jgi:RNA polymerase sigma factor for flagellar operon FliA